MFTALIALFFDDAMLLDSTIRSTLPHYRNTVYVSCKDIENLCRSCHLYVVKKRVPTSCWWLASRMYICQVLLKTRASSVHQDCTKITVLVSVLQPIKYATQCKIGHTRD